MKFIEERGKRKEESSIDEEEFYGWGKVEDGRKKEEGIQLIDLESVE